MRLNAQNLTIERGGRAVLRDVSFAVQSGDALIVTGPNGAGKTSLLRAMAGFLPPVSGNIALVGGEAEAGIGEQCHWIGHLNAVKATLTVAENLAFWSRFLSAPVPARAHRDSSADIGLALSRFNLTALADIPARMLSAGQARRLALARLLVARRPVWLLDEPTVSLDAAGQHILAAVIDAHTGAGGIVIAATHIPLGVARLRELALAPTAIAA